MHLVKWSWQREKSIQQKVHDIDLVQLWYRNSHHFRFPDCQSVEIGLIMWWEWNLSVFLTRAETPVNILRTYCRKSTPFFLKGLNQQTYKWWLPSSRMRSKEMSINWKGSTATGLLCFSVIARLKVPFGRGGIGPQVFLAILEILSHPDIYSTFTGYDHINSICNYQFQPY